MQALFFGQAEIDAFEGLVPPTSVGLTISLQMQHSITQMGRRGSESYSNFSMDIMRLNRIYFKKFVYRYISCRGR